MTGILVVNKSKTRKPDYWMVCKEEFTPDEAKPYLGVMRRNRILFLPEGVSCRWAGLWTKGELLDWLERSKQCEAIKREMVRRLKGVTRLALPTALPRVSRGVSGGVT